MIPGYPAYSTSVNSSPSCCPRVGNRHLLEQSEEERTKSGGARINIPEVYLESRGRNEEGITLRKEPPRSEMTETMIHEAKPSASLLPRPCHKGSEMNTKLDRPREYGRELNEYAHGNHRSPGKDLD